MRDLAVVVPAYNEEKLLAGTLTALAAQSDADFTLVVVDNASTDGTARIAAGFPGDVEVIGEPLPGAGTAADTGFRHAIRGGAGKLLRTDADCLPDPSWVATGRKLLDSADLVCGRSLPRADEHPSWFQRAGYPLTMRLLARAGRLLHRSPSARAPFVLIHGHNLAITAELYLRCGGTAREDLRDGSEDVTLLNRARQHTERIIRAEEFVVQASLRRLRAWGPLRTLLWSWNRRYVPPSSEEVHIR
ncbi:glycosyltransferase family 2 protein [Actinoplanes sp. TFC3]|uniref:glycosyltransferase family 2 protein n=1 Tax=Actinoplanes sp. TFC3 TaxID=1710355 RepID=UPI00083214C5|nr:glycosyltransferase family 2 protein [Actinoplanes sp. TFC3]